MYNKNIIVASMTTNVSSCLLALKILIQIKAFFAGSSNSKTLF